MKKLMVVFLLLLLACPAMASTAKVGDSNPATNGVVAPLNINQASLKELQKLPGVGKVTAEKIIAYREANGPFATVDDLLKVNGMGKKTLAKIRDRVMAQ